MRQSISSNGVNQAGSVLVIALIFLVLLTLIGVTAMQGTTLQERMAGNARDSNVALQAAEASLREAEEYLNQAVVGPFPGGATGLYEEPAAGAGVIPLWEDGSTNWADRGDLMARAPIDDVVQQPRVIIEQLRPYTDPEGSIASDEPLPESRYYRATAEGFGLSNTTRAVLQTTFFRE